MSKVMKRNNLETKKVLSAPYMHKLKIVHVHKIKSYINVNF